MMASGETSVPGVSIQERKRVDWKNFKPRISTNETKIKGLEPARYGLDRPEYNIHKPDVLYTIWCNSIKLLYMRGYEILDEFKSLVYNDYTLEYQQRFFAWRDRFETIARTHDIFLSSSLNNRFSKRLPDGRVEIIQMIYVDYSNPKTRTMSDTFFNDIIKDNDKYNNSLDKNRYKYRLMIISAGDWTTACRKLAANKSITEYKIELVKWDRFYNNSLDNVMSVKYHILTEEEKMNYFLTNNRLPTECCSFTADDPVVFWYGLNPGTLVRIIRDDPYLSNICEERCEYRLVGTMVNPARKS